VSDIVGSSRHLWERVHNFTRNETKIIIRNLILWNFQNFNLQRIIVKCNNGSIISWISLYRVVHITWKRDVKWSLLRYRSRKIVCICVSKVYAVTLLKWRLI